MILDQGIGVHHAQLQYGAMAWGWTWVSAPTVSDNPLSGSWQDVQRLYADRALQRILADRQRIDVHADRQRVEVRG